MVTGTDATFELPRHWIGVRADWASLDSSPWDHLVSVTPAQLATHALLIGATGSGKTNLLHHLIAQDIERGHSICVLDMRGDLIAAALELCAGRVDPSNVTLIDLREKERPCGYSPLFGNGEPYFRALSVLDVVATESDSWGPRLSETLRNALMLLAEAREPLTALESLFYDRSFRLSCMAKAQSEPVLAFWHRFESFSPEKQSEHAMPVLNKVSLLLATPTLRRVLGHPSPVDLEQHLRLPGSVTLVSLAVDELHAAGRMLGSLFLSSVCRETFSRVRTAESHRNPVRLYVDEFEHFGMREFETILAEGRRFGLSVVLAHQTLAQLTPRMRSMILGNVGIKFVFRCGREDCHTLSRDLAGDIHALDFVNLPVGTAVMWARGRGIVEVEINEPLLRDVGLQSIAASELVDDVYALNEAGVGFLPVIEVSPEPLPQRQIRITDIGEDWLCS